MFHRALRPSILKPLQRSLINSSTSRLGLARFLSSDVRNAIEQAIGSAKVVLFMKGTPEQPQCGYSRAMIQLLGNQAVDPNKFAAYNVLEDEELRSGIKEFSNWPTIPQLYLDKEFVGGCDIVMELSKTGELSELLENSGALVEEDNGTESADVKPAERS